MRALLLAGALLAGLAVLLLWRLGAFAPSDPPATSLRLTVPPPPAPLRVIAAGTSLTAQGDWTGKLAAALTQCRGSPVTIEKLALPGASSRWGEPSLIARLARAPSPQIVLIEFAANDAHVGRMIGLAESRRRHAQMIRAAQAAGAAPVLVTMTRVHGAEARERPFLDAYRALYGPLAEETGASVIDTTPAWYALDDEALRRAVPDGSHPTAEAMERLLVPALVEALAPVVCPRAPDTRPNVSPDPSR
ncbi:MAG: GDSL-type esterase/lipase family protein [Sphingomonadaceae bacterium]